MANEPKRALIISPSMDKGGAETFIMKVYREMDKSKYQFDFYLMCDYKSAYEDEIESLGGKIFHMTKKTDSYKNYKKDMRKFFSEHHYETVYRAGGNSLTSLDLKFAKKYGKPSKTIFRSTIAKPPKIGFRQLAHYMYRPFASKHSNIKIAPSEWAADYLFGKKQIREKKVMLIKNGLDYNLFRFNEKTRKNKREELGFSESDKVIIHIGRFAEEKNHSFIIDTFNELLRINNDYKIIFVGEKSGLYEEIYDKALSLIKSKSFNFLGSRNDIPELLMAADALLFPSLYEGMPNVVIEAQAAGLPSFISSTITPSVKITDAVFFYSLKESSEIWAFNIDSYISSNNMIINREIMSLSFPKEYLIKNVSRIICDIFFE